MKGAHDIRSLIRAATASGFKVERTRNNHIKFTSPNGAVYFTGSTPSDTRSVLNIRSYLRRAGLNDRV